MSAQHPLTQHDIDRCPREAGSALGAVVGAMLTLGLIAMCFLLGGAP